MQRFIRTRKATEWPEHRTRPTGWGAFWERLLSFLPLRVANPNYEPSMSQVVEWLIEFPEENPFYPWREIGLDVNAVPVLAGPTDQDYGFWLDTNMTLSDFEDAEPVNRDDFEHLWVRYFEDNSHLNPLD
jgi:hypothetical protein